MAKLLTLVASMLTFAFFFGVVAIAMNGPIEPKTEKETQDWVTKEVAKSKKMLPMDCGNGVTWYDIEGRQKAVNYKYRVDASAQQVMAARSRIEKGIRGSRVLSWMIPNDIDAYASFYDRNYSFVFRMKMEN